MQGVPEGGERDHEDGRADGQQDEVGSRFLPGRATYPKILEARMENSKRRVLAVDDDASIRVMLERVLSRSYDLVLAANGEQALAEIQKRPPDLVLLDLRMPVMDGSELLERLEADGIDVKVVLMTAEIRHGSLDSPLVRARYDKLLGVDVLLETCEAGARLEPAHAAVWKSSIACRISPECS